MSTPLAGQERYYTALRNAMDAMLSKEGNTDLIVRKIAGAQHAQSEFLYNALLQMHEDIQSIKIRIVK